MTMQRLINLTAFAEAAKVLTTCAENNNISGEDITHLRAIEPEFDRAVETLLQLFGATTSTTIPVESSTEVLVETSMETIGESETAVPVPGYAPKFEEVWKSLPKLPHIQVSNLGRVKSEGKESTPRMVCGYMKFYDPVNRKYYILANAVLTAFVGERTASYSPYYRDGNKENCTLENLRWAKRDSSLTTSQIERACKLISENPSLPETEMVNLLVREHTIKSVTALRSILAGNWRTISDRYFLVRQGSIIPTQGQAVCTPTTPQTETETEDEVDDSGNLRGILSLTKDPAFVKKLYAERLEAHKTSSDDLVALVLAYMMLGMEDAATIQKAIHKDFGRKLMVSNSQLKAIIG